MPPEAMPPEATTARPSLAFLPAIALLALLAACDAAEETAEPEIRPVRVIEVAEREAGRTVSLAGTIESQIEVDLAFRIGGRMTERLVNVGDTVEAGQIVARLDPADEQNGLAAAKASLAAANGQLSEARTNYQRQRTLVERDIAARVSLERAEQVLQTAQSAADAAEAQVGIARARLADTELVADAPGVVTARGAEPGEVVTPGRMVARLARDDGRDAVFNAPAALLGQAAPDPVITVAMTLTPDVTARGRVREVAPQADPVTGTFAVRVGLDAPPADMRLGSAVTGQMTVGGIGAGYQIPATALTRSEGQPAVWVVDTATGTVALRPVEIAGFGPAEVLIAGGLEVGETVVTAGVQALRPGQQVRLLGASS